MQDLGGAIHAYQQALTYGPTSQDGAHRARSAVPPHRAVGAADRRPRRGARSSTPTSSDDHQVPARGRSDLGPAAVRRRPGDHRLPAGPPPRSVEPHRAARPRGAVREDRTSPRSTSRSSRRSSTRRRRTPSASRSTSAWPRRGRSGSASSTARPRRSRRSSRSTAATTRRTASSRACTSRPAGGKRSSRPTATTSWRPSDVHDARRPLRARWAQVYEQNLQDVDRAIEAYNDVLSFDADEQRALDALGRLYEKISEWDRAIDVMAHLVQLTERPAQAGRPVLADGPDPVRASSATPRRAEANLLRAPRHRPGARADDGGADQAVLGSR